MKKLTAFITALFLCIVFLCTDPYCEASDAAGSDIRSVITKLIELKLEKEGCGDIQSMISGPLTEKAGRGAEWYIIILGRSGTYDFSSYADALEKYVSENNVPSATGRQKNALALIAAGANSDYITRTADDSIGELGIMSLSYGLHLLNNGVQSNVHTKEETVEKILSAQFEDGGWAVMGEHSDIDVTAMTVQALAPLYDSDKKVKAAVDKAVSMLSERQLESGGYRGFGGENPESSAQVIIALSSLGIDCMTDERFIKNGNSVIDGMLKFRTAYGSFSHEENGDPNDTAAMQALLSLTSYELFKEKGELFYIFEGEKEPLPEYAEAAPEITVTASETNAPEDSIAAVSETAVQMSYEPEQSVASPDYKPAAYIVTASLTVAGCVILLILKKTRMSNFVAVLAIGGAAALFIAFTNFRSAEEYYGGYEIVKTDPIGAVTISIRCDTLIGIGDPEYVPSDGIILDTTEIPIESGETVYDILTQTARKYNIQMQADANGYVAGLAYLYELDYGDLSGWIYHVNGDAPFVHCSEYKLSDGDKIEWLYTLALGNDL